MPVAISTQQINKELFLPSAFIFHISQQLFSLYLRYWCTVRSVMPYRCARLKVVSGFFEVERGYKPRNSSSNSRQLGSTSSWEMLQQPGPIWREQKAKDTAEEEGRREEDTMQGPPASPCHWMFGKAKTILLHFFVCFFLPFSFSCLLSFSSQTHRGSQTSSDRQTSLPWKTLRHLKTMLISSPLILLPLPSSCLHTLGHWDRCISDRNTAKLKCCLVLPQATPCRYLWFLWYHRSIYCHFTWLICKNDCSKGSCGMI